MSVGRPTISRALVGLESAVDKVGLNLSFRSMSSSSCIALGFSVSGEGPLLPTWPCVWINPLRMDNSLKEKKTLSHFTTVIGTHGVLSRKVIYVSFTLPVSLSTQQ